MKRQSDDTESLVYAYGAVAPDRDPHVLAEIERQRGFWDALVQADREHEKRLDASMRLLDSAESVAYAAAADELDRCWDRLRDAIELRNAERGVTKKRKTSWDEKVTAAVKTRNKARSATWALAKAWRKENKEICREFEQLRRDKCKELRKNSGLYWGNYNRVIDDFETARKACGKLGRRVQPYDRSRRDGCLTVQIQRTKSGLGAAPGELMDGTFYQLQVGKVRDGIEKLPRGRRTREARTILDMRIDAAGHMARTQLWMHRPMPDNCRVKSAQLVWRREGGRMIGKLCLTISRPAENRVSESTSACGLDLGWRLEEDRSLRVATTMDSFGKVEHHYLPARWMSAMDQVERLQQHVDEQTLEMAGAIQNYTDLPDKVTSALSRWHPGLGAGHINVRALHDYIRPLRDERSQLPDELLFWHGRYRHLAIWRDSKRGKLMRQRREIYRLLARRLAMSHAVIALEDMDLSKMARTKKRDDASPPEMHASSRAQRVRACVHSLRSEVEHQARKHGSEIVYCNDKTTMRCRECGEVTNQGDRSNLTWTCEHCGAEWDQDVNAAGNMLAVAVGNTDKPIEVSGKAGSMEYEPIEARTTAGARSLA